MTARQKFENFKEPFKLHVGCGEVRLDGWINIDSYAADNGAADIVWDVREGLPVGDTSCELIYSEHLLEHLEINDGVRFLRECHRALDSEGRVRIAMPSLDVLIERSYNGNWKQQDWLSWPEYKGVQTRAEMLNICFRSWGHQWLYDREELHRRLREAGFTKIEDSEWGKSELPALRNLERRKDSLLICEAAR